MDIGGTRILVTGGVRSIGSTTTNLMSRRHASAQIALQFAHDQKALGLDAVCHRVASTANVDNSCCATDVLALTSREDPFPPVMPEAVTQGVLPEFVADDAGDVVPHLGLGNLARALDDLHVEPTWRDSLGCAAQRQVRLHCCVETQGPELLRSIERCLAAA